MLQIKANIDWDGNEIQYDENGKIITVQKKQTEKPEFTENFTEKQKQLIVIVTKDPKIKVLELTQNSKLQAVNPLTKTQKDILSALNLPELDCCMG